MKAFAYSCALCLAALAAPAQAQESDGPPAWDTAWGRLVYAFDDGRFAVLEYPLPFGDNIGRLYIDGLAGEFGGPGPLTGYWSEPDVSHDDEAGDTLICPFPIIDGAGRTTHNWGRLVIAFTDSWFPADFVLMRGRCFEEPRDVVQGKLAPSGASSPD